MGAVIAVIAIVALLFIRRDSTSHTIRSPSTTRTSGEQSVATRSAAIPGARIIRDAKRHVSNSAQPVVDPASKMIIPAEFYFQAPPGVVNGPPDVPAVYEGAISYHDFFEHYWPLMGWFWETASPNFDACNSEFIARGAVRDTGYPLLLAFHIVADGHEAHVAEVFSIPEQWATVFDEEYRECVLRVLAKLRWPAKQVVDVTFEASLWTTGPRAR